MSKKILVVSMVLIMTAVLSADLLGGSIVRWGGNYVGTKAATYVPGGFPPICIQTNGGAPPPPIYSYCYGARPAPESGGAWALAYGNIALGRRITISASGTWGQNTFAGKAPGDTTRCSTYVEVIPNGDLIDLSMYSILESPLESNRLATCELSVVADGETLFSGAIDFYGDAAHTTLTGEFIAAPIAYGENTATIEHIFPGINLAGHAYDAVEIILSTDAKRHSSMPSMTVYGIGILILLLLATGLIFRRTRRINRVET
jgi:hypothetical protein